MAYSKTTPQSETYRRYLKYTTPTSVLVYNTTYTDTWNDSKSGQKMPDYREKIRLGQNASTPFSCDYARLVSAVPGSMSHRIRSVNPPYHEYQQDWDGFAYYNYTKPSHLAVTESEAEAIALTKTYKKVQSELSHMNSPAVLAEFIDVLRQFGSPFRSIIDLTNRRLNRLELARKGLSGSTSFKRIKWSEIVASTYLEYAFGLQPLINDTKSAAETLARLHSEEELAKLRKKIVSRGGIEKVTSVTGSSQPIPTCWNNYQLTTRTRTEHTVQYTVGLDSDPRAELGSNERLLQLLGFQPSNWIPALWEAVPWSWLVDYFTNVSDILEAGATNTARVTWICKTVRKHTTVHYTTRIVPGSNGGGTPVFNVKTHAGLSKVERTTVTRTIPASLGVPPLSVEHPFNDFKKLANMAAVLVSRKPSSSALWLF